MTRILVLGAGYTGMMAAIRAARRTRRHGGRVTLVNPSTRFTERLRLHQVAAGRRLADHQILDVIAGTGIEFVQGRVAAIDPEAHEVTVDTTDGPRVLHYDIAVFAIGAVADTAAVPGIDDHGYTLNSPRTAARLAGRLTELAPGGGTVTICGGGLTGVETAAEIAESHPGLRVVLLSRDLPGSVMGEKARAYLDRALRRLGVEVRGDVEIVKVLPDAVELADGELVSSDATVWTTGVRVSPLAATARIATDERGRILTDATLRSVSHPSIYAVGDAAAIRQSYGTIHGTCQSGIPTATHAADQIGRQVRGRRPKPFRFGYIHQPVSLGRKDAVIQFTHPDDTPRRWFLTGRRAIAYKEFVSSSPIKTYRLSRRFRIPTVFLWTRGGRSNRPA